MLTPTERFARAHDAWLEPPPERERCDRCQEWMVQNRATGEFVCHNPDCTDALDDIEADFMTADEEEEDEL